MGRGDWFALRATSGMRNSVILTPRPSRDDLRNETRGSRIPPSPAVSLNETCDARRRTGSAVPHARYSRIEADATLVSTKQTRSFRHLASTRAPLRITDVALAVTSDPQPSTALDNCLCLVTTENASCLLACRPASSQQVMLVRVFCCDPTRKNACLPARGARPPSSRLACDPDYFRGGDSGQQGRRSGFRDNACNGGRADGRDRSKQRRGGSFGHESRDCRGRCGCDGRKQGRSGCLCYDTRYGGADLYRSE